MPDAIRTHDLQSRSLTLYPAELRAHIMPSIITQTLKKANVSFTEFDYNIDRDNLGVFNTD